MIPPLMATAGRMTDDPSVDGYSWSDDALAATSRQSLRHALLHNERAGACTRDAIPWHAQERDTRLVMNIAPPRALYSYETTATIVDVDVVAA